MTLLYGVRDPERNHAAVLADYMDDHHHAERMMGRPINDLVHAHFG